MIPVYYFTAWKNLRLRTHPLIRSSFP